MATFTVRLHTPLTPTHAWQRIWDLDEHGRVIPLTRLHGDGTGGRPLREDARFVARTGLGPLAVDDVMHVVRFDPPDDGDHGHGHAVVQKQGRVVTGRIDAQVLAEPGGAVVVWKQDIGFLGVPRAAGPVVRAVASVAYRSVLRRLLERT